MHCFKTKCKRELLFKRGLVCAGITNPFKFRECLRILKKMVMNKYFQNRLPPNNQLPANSASSTLSAGHTDSRGGAATNRRAENDGGVVEVRGNAQILRLDDAQPLGERYESISTILVTISVLS